MRDGRPSIGSPTGREKEQQGARDDASAKMTLAAIVDALIAKESSTPARPYVAFSANSGAWILVPDQRHIRSGGLALYHPQSLRGALAKNIIASGAWRPQSRCIREETLDELRTALNGFVGSEKLHCAFYLRAPGPFAKAIVLVMDETGRALAYVKIAATERSARAIAHEADVLERLAGVPNLKSSVPHVIARANWRDYPILILEPGPPRNPPRGFEGCHRAFLAHLRDATRVVRPLGESRMLAEMCARFESCCGALSDGWRARYGWALDTITRRAASEAMPLALAHGDFVPWNMRRNADGSLYVFDWELAAEERIETWDTFHFHLARHASGIEPHGAIDIPSLVDHVQGEWRDFAEILLLAYLTDVSLFCQHRLIESHVEPTNPFIAAAAAMFDALRRRL
jgi:hypothetical protein